MTIDYIDADLKKCLNTEENKVKHLKKTPTLCFSLVHKYFKLSHWNQRSFLWQKTLLEKPWLETDFLKISRYGVFESSELISTVMLPLITKILCLIPSPIPRFPMRNEA